MINSGILASRHRGFDYLLRLNIVNNDQVNTFDTYSDLSNDLIDFSYEVNMVPTTFAGAASIEIIGRVFSSSSDQIRLFIQDNGVDIIDSLRLRLRGSQNFEIYNGFVNDFQNTVVNIRVEFISDDVFVYINNNLELTELGINRPDSDDNSPFVIGAGNFDLYNFKIQNDFWLCNEGSGFDVVSDTLKTATGSTSNAGALTYWNNNVWKKI